MTITAKVIADSICPQGNRLTTMQLRYPRFIHAEFMTHRVFSRNASSSRAIPVEKMIQDVLDDPAMPVSWGSNKPGMQAGDDVQPWLLQGPCEWDDDTKDVVKGQVFFQTPADLWLIARDRAVGVAKEMVRRGLHKQVVNRLLEPFGHITVIVTATEWNNFFDLRRHPDADPTMRALANAMWDEMQVSEPVFRQVGEWHLPYHDGNWDWKRVDTNEIAMISAARCARVSYLNHDGTKPDVKKDLALAERLLSSKHMSPSEHQARVTGDDGTAFWGNFTGWDQFRKMVE